MHSQTIITILSITLPLLGAGIGYFMKSSIEKKKELTTTAPHPMCDRFKF